MGTLMISSQEQQAYTVSVFKVLPVFGKNVSRLGGTSISTVLAIAWEHALNRYEAALMVAYAYVGTLCETKADEAANTFLEELLYIQDEWVRRKFVRAELL